MHYQDLLSSTFYTADRSQHTVADITHSFFYKLIFSSLPIEERRTRILIYLFIYFKLISSLFNMYSHNLSESTHTNYRNRFLTLSKPWYSAAHCILIQLHPTHLPFNIFREDTDRLVHSQFQKFSVTRQDCHGHQSL